nr:unnamed protein product [Digitaria exilis]
MVKVGEPAGAVPPLPSLPTVALASAPSTPPKAPIERAEAPLASIRSATGRGRVDPSGLDHMTIDPARRQKTRARSSSGKSAAPVWSFLPAASMMEARTEARVGEGAR